jgi:hypothetical protein
MAAKYTIVQYLPDPLAGECINIGVIVFGAGQLLARFLDNWERVEAFANYADISFVREFAEQFQEVDPEQLGLQLIAPLESITAETIQSLTTRWIHSIQLTPPGFSIKDPGQLMETLAPRYLKTATAVRSQAPTGRPRQTAAKFAASALERAVREKNYDITVRRKHLLSGGINSYRFDAVAMNGQPYVAAQGFSFEVSDQNELERNVDALGFAVADVRDRFPDLPIGIVALRRRQDEEKEPYLRALSLFGYYKVRMLDEQDAVVWAAESLTERATIHMDRIIWHQQYPGAADAQVIAAALSRSLSILADAPAAAIAELAQTRGIVGSSFSIPEQVRHALTTHVLVAERALATFDKELGESEVRGALKLVGFEPEQLRKSLELEELRVQARSSAA